MVNEHFFTNGHLNTLLIGRTLEIVLHLKSKKKILNTVNGNKIIHDINFSVDIFLKR